MKKALIDSDIVLDVHLNRKPFLKNSEKIISLCDQGKIKGFTTPLIIANIYYLLKRTVGRQRALEEIHKSLSVFDVLPMDGGTLAGAIHAGFDDFEDALQNQAAENGKMDMILTRNTKDYKKSTLTVMSPEVFLKTIENT